jgi:cytochrome c553
MNKLFSTMSALAVASVTALFAPLSGAQEVKGDVVAGHKKVAMCMGCHNIVGYQATFPEVYKVPMISGQGGKYITAALNEYKTGARKHPTMRAIADSLTDQDIADVAAYYEASGKDLPANTGTPREPSVNVAELVKKGNCISCHGDGFAKPIDPAYPKVAGQHADYLYAALKAYKTEGNQYTGRSNGVMGGVAKQFSNAELKALAQYVSTLPGDLKVVPESRFR